MAPWDSPAQRSVQAWLRGALGPGLVLAVLSTWRRSIVLDDHPVVFVLSQWHEVRNLCF